MAEAKADYRQALTDKLIEQLEAGTAPWQKPWDAKEGIGRLPYNPTTDKEYRGANSLYLAMQGKEDPRWATYKQAAAEGWQVRKGEKGTLIEYWKMAEERPAVDDKGKPILDESGKQKTINVRLEKPEVFRAVVFNAQQMDGVPELSKEPRERGWNPVERAEGILAASGAKIYHDQNDRAFYAPSKDEIHLPAKEQFKDQAAYYSTALHELGHWTGHESRLKREFGTSRGTPEYAKEELRAELSSYFMADKLGVPHDPGQHAAYVKSWVSVLKDDKNEIFRAARDAEKITEYVLQLDQDRTKERTLDKARDGENRDISDSLRESRAAFAASAAAGQSPQALDAEVKALEKLDAATTKALGPGVKLPQGWTGAVEIKAMVEDNNFDGERQVRFEKEVKAGERADFYRVSGKTANGAFETIAERPELDQAKALAVRLSEVNRLADLPTRSTGLETSAKGLSRDDPGVKRSDATASPDLILTTTRTALEVPFKDKDAAKEHGAKWDKEAKEWFVPPGRDLTPLTKWLPKQDQQLQPKGAELAAEIATDAQAGKPRKPEPAAERQVLAVPFKEKDEASKAGAKWDKAEKTWYAPPEADLAKLEKWLPKREIAQDAELKQNIDPQAEFGKALKAAGLDLGGSEPVMDGKLQRVPVENGKKGNRDGAYVGYLDGKPSGHIQNFSSGSKENWTMSGAQLSQEEQAQLAAQAQIVKQQRAAELSEQHDKASVKAGAKFDRLPDAPKSGENAYLARKQVEAHGVKFDGEKLVVPLRDVDGKLWSVQSIPPAEGAVKMFEKGGRKAGNMHVIGEIKPGAELLVAEGYATGASLHQATGKTVAVAFDSGNLDAVVGALKARHPTSPIFIMGDNDKHRPENPGMEKATAAAQKHQVGVAFPEFKTAGKLSDFNDLHVHEGLQAVKAQVDKALGQAVEQSRERGAGVARDKLGEGTEVKQPGPNTRHTGEVLGVDGYHATQATSKKSAVVHQVRDLDQVPAPGQVVTVQYQKGRAKVTEKAVEQQKEKQLAR